MSNLERGNNVKIMMRGVLLVIIIGLLSGCKTSKSVPVAEIRHTEWCVNVCMEDVIDDMQSSVESWGTSSPPSGMTQSNTLLSVENMCRKIYKTECLSLGGGNEL